MPAQPHRSILLLMPLAEGCATGRTDNPFGRSTDDAERRPQPHHGATIAVIFSLQAPSTGLRIHAEYGYPA